MKKRNIYTRLFIALCATSAGIYIQRIWNIPPYLLTTSLLGAISFAIISFYRKNILALSCSIAFLSGCAGSILITLQRYEHELCFKILSDKKITIIGTVIDKDEWANNSKGEVLRLAINEIDDEASSWHQHISCEVLAYSKNATSFCVGDTLLIKNVVIKKSQIQSQNDNPCYDDYLIKENIVSSIFVIGPSQCTCITHPAWSLRRLAWNIRNTLYQSIKQKISPQTCEFFGLIFLGNKQQPSINELRTKFNYWGLSHYLARSGLHVVLFIIIWTSLLKILPFHLRIKRLLLIIICAIYDLVSWTSIPFARAYYAFLCMQAGEILYQSINYLHILTMICLGILLFNPMQLFFLDFQLTFGLTFTLVFLSSILTSHKQSLVKGTT